MSHNLHELCLVSFSRIGNDQKLIFFPPKLLGINNALEYIIFHIQEKNYLETSVHKRYLNIIYRSCLLVLGKAHWLVMPLALTIFRCRKSSGKGEGR